MAEPDDDTSAAAAAPVAVAVLAGGLSLERDVSLRSGRRVATALAERGFAVRRLDLDPQLLGELLRDPPDLVFLALHGSSGEDGGIQRLLELFDVTYTGSDPLASSLAWDKPVCKGLLQRAGLDTPRWVTLGSDSVRDFGAGPALERVAARLGQPLVVKPSQGGASMGVRVVHDERDLAAALVAAFSYHDVVLAESLVEGTEVAVSVVADEALPPVEIVPTVGRYDFAARYTSGGAQLYAPARLPDEVLQRCRDVALHAYRVVGCRHLARVDMIVDDRGRPFVLELDTCPGLTDTSLLPAAVSASGSSLPAVIERVARLALTGSGAARDGHTT